MPQGMEILRTNITTIASSEINVSPEHIEKIVALLPGVSDVALEGLPTESGRRSIITNLRHQLRIAIEPKRIALFDDSGQHPKDKDEKWFALAKDIHTILNVETRAHGFNYEIEFESPNDRSSGEQIVSCLIKENVLQKLSGQAIGAWIRFQIRRQDVVYMFIFEPRRGDPTASTIFAKFNAHFDVQGLPEPQDLKQRFASEFDALINDSMKVFG